MPLFHLRLIFYSPYSYDGVSYILSTSCTVFKKLIYISAIIISHFRSDDCTFDVMLALTIQHFLDGKDLNTLFFHARFDPMKHLVIARLEKKHR